MNYHHEVDEKLENERFEENLFTLAQQAIKDGDEQQVNTVIEKLRAEGFNFSADMIKKDWDDQQEKR